MTIYNNSELTKENSKNNSGAVQWNSPSNIALVKYWGKYGEQLPHNPSISFTLNSSFTTTKVLWSEKKRNTQFDIDFLFENKKKDSFIPKIETFFSRVETIFPFLKEYKFQISSKNSFPHSAGIASSASSMSAMALCLCSMEKEIFGGLANADDFFKKASFVARLGSGSACRSLFPFLATWGDQSLEFGTACTEYHQVFSTFQDSILIVSDREKEVSSSLGHTLMIDHPYAKKRFENAKLNFETLGSALLSGDLNLFIDIVEKEALELHAMMMTSSSPYILMLPNTIELINRIRSFRKDKGVPVCFTLDAGPNVHLLYPKAFTKPVLNFISEQCLELLPSQRVIEDQVGSGPSQLEL